MRKVVHLLVLVAAIAGLMAASSADNPAPAQDKKKVEAKVLPLETTQDVGTIEVYTDKKGQWRYRVKVNEKSIAVGTIAYDKKEDLLKSLELAKATMAKGKVVEIPPTPKKGGDKGK